MHHALHTFDNFAMFADWVTPEDDLACNVRLVSQLKLLKKHILLMFIIYPICWIINYIFCFPPTLTMIAFMHHALQTFDNFAMIAASTCTGRPCVTYCTSDTTCRTFINKPIRHVVAQAHWVG